MFDYLVAVRRWVDSVERVANTSPAVGLPADPHDPIGWVAATDAERTTSDVLEAAARVWVAP